MKKIEQANKALIFPPNNSIGIPEMSSETYSGSATSTTANKLVDSSKTFDGEVEVGYIVYNHTDNTIATVTAIDSDTTLSLSADIMASAETYSIYSKETKGCAIYIGVSGDISVEMSGNKGKRILYTAAPVGYHPINVTKVFSTATTATNIIALFGE